VVETRTDSGLWVATHGVSLLKFRARKKTVTMANGERALITVDDSGTVLHREHGDHLDAVVRPKTIRLRIPIRQVGG